MHSTGKPAPSTTKKTTIAGPPTASIDYISAEAVVGPAPEPAHATSARPQAAAVTLPTLAPPKPPLVRREALVWETDILIGFALGRHPVQRPHFPFRAHDHLGGRSSEMDTSHPSSALPSSPPADPVSPGLEEIIQQRNSRNWRRVGDDLDSPNGAEGPYGFEKLLMVAYQSPSL